jgi:anti-anti-sigma factor
MNSTLRLAVSIDDRNIHTVSLSGELDEASCAELAECLGECRGPGARVLLDLRDLNFMDGAGLALLERTYVESALEGWTFAVMTPGERYVARARAA